jgi:branched-chain amino acid transport system substrate-binding protein
MAVKVAFLVPQSGVAPFLGRDFTNGLRFGFEQYEETNSFEIIIEPVAFGENAEVLAGACQKALLQHQADIAIIFTEKLVLEEIVNFATVNKFPILITNLGGYMMDDNKLSDYVFYNSFNMWKSTWLMGRYAAENINNQFASASDYYDAGYQFLPSFLEGFMEGKGEIPLFNFVNRHDAEPNEHLQFLDRAKEHELKATLVALSGDSASKFAQMSKSNQLTDKIAMLATYFSVFEMQPYQVNSNAENFYTAATWDQALELPQNEKFTSDYYEEFDEAATVFSELGYEAALFVANACASLEGEKIKSKNLTAALKNVVIDGPRGSLQMNESHQTTPNDYLMQVQLDENTGTAALKQIQKLESETDMREKIREINEVSVSGWRNPYLCI